MNIVIDTNIFMSALIKEGTTREIITNFNHNFLLPEFAFEEIEEHKLEIIKKSKLFEREFNILFLRLLKYIRIIPTDIISPYRKEASEIMGEIDKEDIQFIAAALAFNCPIWSNDKHFKMQNKVSSLTTPEMKNNLGE
jgi:predicted nucleic acid-binding protein